MNRFCDPSQTSSDDPGEDSQEEADETDRLTKNGTQAQKGASAVYSHADNSIEILFWVASNFYAFVLKCCDWILTIFSCIYWLYFFKLMWIYVPKLTFDYKQANEHLNGTVSHSPNYFGFGERQSLVCNTTLSIGTVLPTGKTFLAFLD